jgi:hypothetical protein
LSGSNWGYCLGPGPLQKEVQMKLVYGMLVAALVGIVVIGTLSPALEAG